MKNFRFVFTAVLLYFVSQETGVATTICLFLISCGVEIIAAKLSALNTAIGATESLLSHQNDINRFLKDAIDDKI